MENNQIIRILANARFKARSDTRANWEALNPVLLAGEPAIVTDGNETEKIKFGDGVTAWNDLDWWKGPKGEQGPQGETGPQGEKGIKGDNGKDAITDQSYNPESENAQSGKAVAEAISNNLVTKEDLKNEVASQLDGAKADIVTEIIAQLGGLPVFGTVGEDNTITVTSTLADGDYVLMYENEDGALAEIGSITIGEKVAAYTNLADPTGESWKENTRINSSYNEVAAEGVITTNYIAVKADDVIRIKNMELDTGSYSRVVQYDKDGIACSVINPFVNPELFSLIDDVTVFTAFEESSSAWDNECTHIRICGYPTGASQDVIITVNEEIT